MTKPKKLSTQRQAVNQRDRRSRVQEATTTAMRQLADAARPGDVYRELVGTYKLYPNMADKVMRSALASLIPEYGYMHAQLKAISQRCLQQIVARSSSESLRLRAAKMLKQYFAPDESNQAVVHDFVLEMSAHDTVRLTTERNRLQAEHDHIAKKLHRAQKRVSTIWSGDKMRKEYYARNRDSVTKLQETISLLAHPFRRHEIIDIMTRRHGIGEQVVDNLITDALKIVDRDQTLHPVQIELMNQRLAINTINSKTTEDADKLRAVDTLMNSTPGDGGATADDAYSMQLRARTDEIDKLQITELEQLKADLWEDATRRWGWIPKTDGRRQKK